MRIAKPILFLCLSLAALSLAGGCWMVATEAASMLDHASLAADAIAQAPALLNARVDQATAKADAQLTALRTEALATIKDSLEVADGRLASIQADLKPVLINAASLTKDAQDSLDDLYPDIRGTVESGAVAVTSVAQAAEAMRDAAPKVAASVVSMGKSGDGIASDVHTATTDFVRPKTRWQKFKAVLETAGKIGARLL